MNDRYSDIPYDQNGGFLNNSRLNNTALDETRIQDGLDESDRNNLLQNDAINLNEDIDFAQYKNENEDNLVEPSNELLTRSYIQNTTKKTLNRFISS